MAYMKEFQVMKEEDFFFTYFWRVQTLCC